MGRSSRGGGGAGRSSSGGRSIGGGGRSSSGGHRSAGSSSRSASPSRSTGNSRGNQSGGSALGRGIAFGVGQQIGRNLAGGGSNNHNNRNYRQQGTYYNSRGRHTGTGRGAQTSISSVLIIVIIAMIVLAFMNSEPNIPKSTAERDKITNIASGDVLTYQDATYSGGWFTGSRAMENGANEAHKLTGVKFGVFVTDLSANVSNADLMEAADSIYEDWFGGSPGHLLLYLADLGNGDYAAFDIIGGSARTVFDNEAMEILYGYLDTYWEQPDRYNESEMFGMTLQKTAERIMSITPTFGARVAPFIGIALVALIAFIGVNLALRGSARRKEAAAAQAQAEANLLNTPVAGLDSRPDDDLLNKYSGEENNNKT